MNLTPELKLLLTELDGDPDAGAALLREHAPMVADTIGKAAWSKGYDSGYDEGREADHPHAMSSASNPYEQSLLSHMVDQRFIGVVEDGEHTRHLLIRGSVSDSTQDQAVLNEARSRRDLLWLDWNLTRQETRHLIPGKPTDLGALVTTDGEAFVEPAFAESDPNDAVCVVTLTLSDRPLSRRYAEHDRPRARLGRITGRHLRGF